MMDVRPSQRRRVPATTTMIITNKQNKTLFVAVSIVLDAFSEAQPALPVVDEMHNMGPYHASTRASQGVVYKQL